MTTEPAGRGRALRSLRATWLSVAGLCATALILGQAVWRGIYLSRGYFTQDDFDLMRIGLERAMGPGLLLQNHGGHFWPLQWVVVWVTARSAGLDWFLVAASILGAQLVAGVLFWLVLTRIIPGSAWRLPLLALFLFSPLSLGSTQWWAQAVAYLPSTVCLLAALLGALRWVQDGRRLGAWACVVFVALGLLIQERAIFYPLVIVAFLLLLDPTQGLVRRVRVVIRRRWVMLLGLAVVTTAFLVAHLVLALPSEARQGYTADSVLRLAGNYVGRTLLPGLAGGPWSFRLVNGVLVVPAVATVAAAAVLTAGLMAWTLWRSRGRAAGAWLLLWSYVLLNLAAVMVGRPQFGTQIGLLPRYAADVVPVAALALAFVVRSIRAAPAHESRFPRLRRTRPAVPWLVTVALVVSCALTTTVMAPIGYNRDDEKYVATLVRGLDSEPEAVLYDSLVPDNVMIGWFADRRFTSTVLAGTDEQAVFDVPSENMRMVDDRGRLVDFILTFPTRARAGPVDDCGYPVSSQDEDPAPQARHGRASSRADRLLRCPTERDDDRGRQQPAGRPGPPRCARGRRRGLGNLRRPGALPAGSGCQRVRHGTDRRLPVPAIMTRDHEPRSERAIMTPRPWLGYVLMVAVGALALGPALLPGYVLVGDMTFVPHQPWKGEWLGLDGSPPRAVPADAFVSLLTHAVPGDLVQKVVLLAVFVLGGLGVMRLLTGLSPAARAGAAVLYVWNPYVYERLAIGHWGLLLGLAALPWVVLAANRVRQDAPRSLLHLSCLLAFAAFASPTGGLVAGVVGLVMASRRGHRAQNAKVGAVAVLVNLPWLVPGVLGHSAASDPSGAAAFAARSDTPLGSLGSLVSLGGIWKSAVVPLERSGWVLPTIAVLVSVLALARLWLVRDQPVQELPDLQPRRLLACGLVALALAWLPTIDGGAHASALLIEHLPGAGLLRDSQKWLMPLVLCVAVGFGLIVDRVGARLRTIDEALSWVVLLFVVTPLLLLPSLAWGLSGHMRPVAYPDEWHQVARQMEAAGAASDRVAVLPWSAYVRYPWNDDRAALDPAIRYFPGKVITSDDLVLGDDTVVRGDSSTARAIGRAVERGTSLGPVLRANGVRWVLVEKGVPTSSPVPDPGGVVVHDGRAAHPGGSRADGEGLGPGGAHPSCSALTCWCFSAPRSWRSARASGKGCASGSILRQTTTRKARGTRCPCSRSEVPRRSARSSALLSRVSCSRVWPASPAPALPRTCSWVRTPLSRATSTLRGTPTNRHHIGDAWFDRLSIAGKQGFPDAISGCLPGELARPAASLGAQLQAQLRLLQESHDLSGEIVLVPRDDSRDAIQDRLVDAAR